MKKNFKNSLGVSGSPAQLEAFKEWAGSIGYEHQLHKLSYPHYYLDHLCGTSYYANCNDNDVMYTLPAQWAEAMQAAQEVEDLNPVIGDWLTVVGDGINADIYKKTHPTFQVNNVWDNIVHGRTVGRKDSIYNIRVVDCRPATPEEIANANKTEFKTGEKVVDCMGCVILVGNVKYHSKFSGQVISEDSVYSKGFYSESWDKELFTLHTEPVTL